MKPLKQTQLLVGALLLLFVTYFSACKHDDLIVSGSGANIVRGNLRLGLSNSKVTHDKSHSNVNWSTAYAGGASQLTGRFNMFGFKTFEFAEDNKDSIMFEAWVRINTVNTSEPGRDTGCLQTTYGVNTKMLDEPANLAIIKSKSVEYSTKDKGYFVKCDFTFHGVTKEVTAKLDYAGLVITGSGATLKYVYGFDLSFSFLAKTDYLISSTSIADKVDINCNAIFRRVP